MSWGWLLALGPLVAPDTPAAPVDRVARSDAVMPDAAALLAAAEARAARLRTASYVLHKEERLRDGEWVVEAVVVKLRTRPFAVYVAARLPRPGQEIIYDEARDSKRFWVHPGRFPDLTWRLELRGGVATQRQHHLISGMGWSYLLRLLTKNTGGPGGWEPVRRQTRAGREVLVGRWQAEPTPMARAQAEAGESLFAFAARLGVDPYYLVYCNPGLEGVSGTVEAGAYLVPRYGSAVEVAFDAEWALPVSIVVWDEAGLLYERYRFTEVLLDPPLGAADFDPDNPAYRF